MDYKAFVSSTAKDLLPHRAHVIQELRRAGFHVDPMEDWPASADEPKKFSQERLDGCHLCVLLIARRRGFVPPGEEHSITQLEYREALRLKIDVLPYFLDNAETDWPAEFDERKTHDKLAAWRAEVEERHGRELFNKHPASIGIGSALARWVREDGFKVALGRYLQLVEHEHGYIRFVSLPQIKDNANVPIKSLYVEPAVAPRWVSPDLDPKEWPATQPVLDAVAEHQRLVLLGDPGSGKSTLVSWIAWQLARHHHDGTSLWTERLGRLVPLPMILRDLGIGPGVTWDKLLDAFTQQPMGKLLTLTNLRKLLADGRAMIMLDGLDEIGNPGVRRDLRDAVWIGMEKYDDCHWVLTSRIVGYEEVSFDTQQVGLRRVKFEEMLRPTFVLTNADLRYVAPFDDPRVDQFAHNWNILREPSESQARQNAKNLLEAVRNHESTRKLGRIPNLLTMMALIFRIKARLPHGRALLYDDIAEAYLEAIDWYRGIRTRLEPLDEKKRWLGRVAFEMQRQRSARTGVARPESAKGVAGLASRTTPFADSGRATLDEIFASSDDVCRWIAAAMSESGTETNAEDAALVVADLARRSGLLLPRGHDRFAFLHLSFQEYFAAGFLQDQIISPAWLTDDADAIAPGAAKQDLYDYARSPVWRETLVFLVELLFNGNRRWLKPTRDCLFGRDFATVTPDDPLASGLAVLLAHLAVDPHSGFTDTERQQAIAACCRVEVTRQKRAADKGDLSFHVNEVAQVLFGADPEYRTLVAQSFVEAVQAIGLTEFQLDFTRVSDLSPFAGLSGLTMLFLSWTPVRDLSPLAELSELTTIGLDGTQLSDLSPLAGLAKLETLYLRSRSVSDEELAAFRAERERKGLGEVRIERS